MIWDFHTMNFEHFEHGNQECKFLKFFSSEFVCMEEKKRVRLWKLFLSFFTLFFITLIICLILVHFNIGRILLEKNPMELLFATFLY